VKASEARVNNLNQLQQQQAALESSKPDELLAMTRIENLFTDPKE
jgi:hypothetical protein